MGYTFFERSTNDKIKAHWEKYKTIYIAAGVSLAVSLTVCITYSAINGGIHINYSIDNSDHRFITKNGIYTEANVRLGHPGKRIIDVDSGETWDSIAECYRSLGVSRKKIQQCINGLNATAGGRHLLYIGDAA